jgi:hypothetical protein
MRREIGIANGQNELFSALNTGPLLTNQLAWPPLVLTIRFHESVCGEDVHPAMSIYSHTGTLTYHILLPFRIHLSPFFSARVLMPATSEPAPGSVCIRQSGPFRHTCVQFTTQ